ncbi:MAG: peptidoglycan DD-metalloendopeptidase family protein [Bacteroidales bacterium]|jgi:septal ring factor EnvC (AmiA/AmiB activator)|nr:peptidoglycan DD-metalloendopeptidase family protein [Bacteroidales bacterium]
MRNIVLLLLFAGFMANVFPQPQSKSEFKELQRKQRDLLLLIEETSKKLGEMDETVASSLKQLNLLTQKVQIRKQYIAGINGEIAGYEKEISQIQKDIDAHSTDLNREKQLYAEIVRNLQKNNYFNNKLLYILSAKSLAQSYRRFEYLRELYASQKKQLKNINDKQTELVLKQKALESNRAEKLSLLSLQQVEDMKLFEEEKKQRDLVNQLKSKQGALRAELIKQQVQEKELNELIEKAISEDIDRSVRTYDSDNQEQQTESPSGSETTTAPQKETVPGHDFAANKGKLPLPVSGKFLVVSHFGEQMYQELDQKTVNNRGVDIQAISGNTAKAVYDGEVSSVTEFQGYHTLVIVRHGEYFTVYANLASSAVKKGDKVTSGQTIGTIYKNTEKGDIPVLHFQLKKGKTNLNPEEWLKMD